ncbi:MAG: threonine ammonia-lyase [Candidatus Limnocylindrales bacterium]
MPDPITRDVTLDDIRVAAEVLRGHVRRTPLLPSRTAARLAGDRSGARLGSGGEVGRALAGTDGDEPCLFVKAEHLQLTGSFKPRGAIYRVARLNADERRRGVIALSAGNHAQAVALAAARAGVASTVVMPEGASRAKAAAAAAYGAEVVLYGEHVGETFRRLHEIEAERGLTFLHPFDDPDVIAGQGTMGLEIVEQLPEVDVIVAGIGGGGLISGIASAVKRLRPQVRLYGVEPELSNAVSLGLAAGEPVTIQPVSIADGLGAPFAGSWTIPIVRRFVETIVLVDEATIAGGMAFALERMKQLLEPAGAAALGAVLEGRIPLRDGETVCVVASGGNVDLARLPDLLAMAGPVERS